LSLDPLGGGRRLIQQPISQSFSSIRRIRRIQETE
jgi:hypothetical protein